MKTFTIDTDNNISAFATQEEAAAAATTTPFDTFASQQELGKLAAAWPTDRLVAIWNSLPGVAPAKGFKGAKAAASKIWERIQKLGEPEKPKAERKAKGGAQAAKGGPAKAKATKKASPAKSAPKGKKKGTPAPVARDGSKTATVVGLLERKGGATLAEIMKVTAWQAHSVRGFISGTLGKKMGRTVESTKREDGERLYQLKG